MKVKDLIIQLQTVDPELEVLSWDDLQEERFDPNDFKKVVVLFPG